MFFDIVRLIMKYPMGTVIGFYDEFGTDFREVVGYKYHYGRFYILLSNGGMVHMKRMEELDHSIIRKRRIGDGSQ